MGLGGGDKIIILLHMGKKIYGQILHALSVGKCYSECARHGNKGLELERKRWFRLQTEFHRILRVKGQTGAQCDV